MSIPILIERLKHAPVATVMLLLTRAVTVGLLLYIADQQTIYIHQQTLAYDRQTQWHKDYVAARKITDDRSIHNEEMLLRFEIRTVHRWKDLSEANPGLNVPKVSEPVDPPFIALPSRP